MARHTSPPRSEPIEDGRVTLCLLQRSDQTIHLVLVALTDAVELEIWADGSRRRRMRFLRDTEARKYGDRLAERLARRGFARPSPS